MKAYITGDELYPCYTINMDPGSCGAVIDVPEETLDRWDKIIDLFHQHQGEIRQAIREYEQKQDRLKHLQNCFANPNPSRRDKEYLLPQFGWNQLEVSLWEKDGRQLRLHEAYNECKTEFERTLHDTH